MRSIDEHTRRRFERRGRCEANVWNDRAKLGGGGDLGSWQPRSFHARSRRTQSACRLWGSKKSASETSLRGLDRRHGDGRSMRALEAAAESRLMSNRTSPRKKRAGGDRRAPLRASSSVSHVTAADQGGPDFELAAHASRLEAAACRQVLFWHRIRHADLRTSGLRSCRRGDSVRPGLQQLISRSQFSCTCSCTCPAGGATGQGDPASGVVGRRRSSTRRRSASSARATASRSGRSRRRRRRCRRRRRRSCRRRRRRRATRRSTS